MGESILLGCEILNRQAIPELHTNAFTLIGEVMESKVKPSLPFGEICLDALGKQDTLISGLSLSCAPRNGTLQDRDLEILGASSDHLLLNSQNSYLKVGSSVNFNLDYGSLLMAMTSPFIKKQFIK